MCAAMDKRCWAINLSFDKSLDSIINATHNAGAVVPLKSMKTMSFELPFLYCLIRE